MKGGLKAAPPLILMCSLAPRPIRPTRCGSGVEYGEPPH
jgi:hypothetical protein